jgi:hypothetical protein
VVKAPDGFHEESPKERNSESLDERVESGREWERMADIGMCFGSKSPLDQKGELRSGDFWQ